MNGLKKKQKVFESMNFEKDDRLNRKNIAEIFDKLFENTSQPFVIALNSSWGTGKTQFIYMWRNLLKSKKKESIYLNLWEEDFFQSPFFSLTESLIPEFKKRKIDNLKRIKKNILKLGKEIGKSTINKFVGLNINNLFEANSNKKKKKDKEEFKENLRKLSIKIKEKTNSPFIIFIDELDRCRPDYAIEFLEIVKHFFDVEDIIFILGIDIDQLQYSIKSLYGQEMNAKEYLRKFIDFSYSLPEPELEKYLEFLFSEFQCGKKEQNLIKISKEIISKFNPSLRKVDNLFTRLKLIEKNINNTYIEATFLLSLKIFEENKYNKLIKNSITIDDLLDLKSYFNGIHPDYRDIIFWKLTNDLILKESYSELNYIDNLREFFSKFNSSPVLERYDPRTVMRIDEHFSMGDLFAIFRNDNQINDEKNQEIIINLFRSRNHYLSQFVDLINKIDFLKGLDFGEDKKGNIN